MSIKRYIPELDGVRGMAVFLVMVFHFMHLPLNNPSVVDNAFVYIAMGGWIGVDLFFVLSGFLITGILLDSRGQRDFFTSFYVKRALRIFPLYYLYLAFLFFLLLPLIFAKVDEREQLKILAVQAAEPWFWLYLSNIKQVIQGAFFGAGAAHLWSLSIEEQFYIIWPFLVFFLSIKRLRTVTIGLIVASLLIRVIAYYNGVPGMSIYVFTLTRMDALAFGALAAISSKSKDLKDYSFLVKAFWPLVVFTLATIYIFGPRADSNPIVYTIGFSLLAAVFSLLVMILQSGSYFSLRSLFLKRWLIYLGKYSYSLYMFHPLVRQLMLRIMGEPKTLFHSNIPWSICFICACLAVSIIVSFLSWHCFEKWFLRIKARYEVRRESSLLAADETQPGRPGPIPS